MSAPGGDLELRRATDDDTRAVLDLLREALGWNDPRDPALFEWKHRKNPFGPSPTWIALDRDRVVGLRTFMRWELERGDRRLRAVRAVDTATHPAYQRRGVFSRLTLLALGELERQGVDFVFNTPNERSLPGYRKLGWQVVGRLPITVRPASVRGLRRMARARIPAEAWSSPSSAGVPAAEVLQAREPIARLVDVRPRSDALRTVLSLDYLAWRYGTPLLGYRALVAPTGIENGVAFFRVRDRGAAREVALCELLAPGGRSGRHQLARQLARDVDADYVLALAGAGGLRLPAQGPVLAWRDLGGHTMPRRSQWALGLGDIERL